MYPENQVKGDLDTYTKNVKELRNEISIGSGSHIDISRSSGEEKEEGK